MNRLTAQVILVTVFLLPTAEQVSSHFISDRISGVPIPQDPPSNHVFISLGTISASEVPAVPFSIQDLTLGQQTPHEIQQMNYINSLIPQEKKNI